MNRIEFLDKWTQVVSPERAEEFKQDFLYVLLGKQYINKQQTVYLSKHTVPDFNDDLA